MLICRRPERTGGASWRRAFTGAGSFWIRYSVAGRQYREPTGTASKALAEQVLAKRKLEVFEGRFFPDKKRGDLTIGGLRDLWLTHAAHKRSLKDDRQRVATVVAFFGPSTRIAAKAALVELESWPRALDGRVLDADAATLSSAFSRLCRRLGIDGLHFHDLRHTALTNLRRAGVDLFTMRRISGHRTLKMLERYQTITGDDLRAAVARAEKLKE